MEDGSWSLQVSGIEGVSVGRTASTEAGLSGGKRGFDELDIVGMHDRQPRPALLWNFRDKAVHLRGRTIDPFTFRSTMKVVDDVVATSTMAVIVQRAIEQMKVTRGDPTRDISLSEVSSNGVLVSVRDLAKQDELMSSVRRTDSQSLFSRQRFATGQLWFRRQSDSSGETVENALFANRWTILTNKPLFLLKRAFIEELKGYESVYNILVGELHFVFGLFANNICIHFVFPSMNREYWSCAGRLCIEQTP